MLNTARIFCWNSLAVFGSFGLLSHALLFFLFGTTFRNVDIAPSDAFLKVYPSPEKKSKAVLFSEVGPAFSPHCIEHLQIVPLYVEDRLSWGDENNVVVTGCSGITNVEWMSEREVRITINLTLGLKEVDRMILKGYGDGSNIKVLYAR